MKVTECTQANQPVAKARATPPEDEPRDVFEPRPWPREAQPERIPERKPPPEPSGPLTDLLGKAEAANSDLQSAREIAARMVALRRLTDAKIAALLADAQTQVFTIWQEVMARRRKAADDALARWNKLLFE